MRHPGAERAAPRILEGLAGRLAPAGPRQGRDKLGRRAAPAMPLVNISMYPGRTQQQKDDFARAVTESAMKILGAKAEHVIVVFEEHPPSHWFVGGKPLGSA